MFAAFSKHHPDLSVVEIDILDSQTHQLDTAQIRTLQKRRHQVIKAVKLRRQSRNFSSGQNHSQFELSRGAVKTRQVAYCLPQELSLEKYSYIQRQGLSTCRDISFGCRIGEKTLGLVITKIRWMTFTADQNEKLDPVQLGINRPSTVALYPHEIFDRFEKMRPRHVQHLIHEMCAGSYTLWKGGRREGIPRERMIGLMDMEFEFGIRELLISDKFNQELKGFTP